MFVKCHGVADIFDAGMETCLHQCKSQSSWDMARCRLCIVQYLSATYRSATGGMIKNHSVTRYVTWKKLDAHMNLCNSKINTV